METPSLEYFIEVANLQNLSKAAETLNISQQGLSSYIKRLERHYNVELFVRKPHLLLTPAGERLLTAARAVHQIHEELNQDMAALSTSSEVKITIGIFSPMLDMAMSILPLEEFGRKYPAVSFRFISGFNSEILELLLRSSVDFCISAVLELSPEHQNAFEFRRLVDDREYLIISDSTIKKHFSSYPGCIDTFTSGVSLADFVHVPMVLPPANSGIVAKLKQYSLANDLKFKILGEGSSQQITNSMVAQNMAFGLCRQHSLPLPKGNEPVYAFPINEPYLHRADGLVYQKNRRLSAYVTEFLDLIETRWRSREALLPPA